MSVSTKYERFFPVRLTVLGGTIHFEASNSLYHLIPADIVKAIFEQYGLDLIKNRKHISFETSLVEERQVKAGAQDPLEITILVKLKIPDTIPHTTPKGDKK
jgi:hypothetical protein